MAFGAFFNSTASADYGRWLARYHGWLLAALWGAVQLICWRHYQGPRLFGDGLGYISYARQLAYNEHFAEGHFLRYAGYAAFLSLFLKLRLGLLSMGLAQVGLSGLAMRAFYRTAWRLGGQHWPTAALATAVLIGWFEVQAFNSFILTESLFTSLLLFSLWAVARVKGLGSAALAGGLLLLTALVRPNGFVALGAGAGAVLCWLHQAGRLRHPRRLVLLLPVLVPLVWALDKWSVGVLNFMEDYRGGTVIYNYPQASLTPPAALQMPSGHTSQLSQVVWFVAHNFRYASQLAALRLTYFLGFPKPWHSPLHIVWLVLTLPATYWLAIRGVGNRVAALPVRTYLVACLLLQISIILVTFEDWDVRFSGPMIPYWLMLAALGAQPGLRRLARRLPGCSG
ncbi:MAG: hypothetical protein EOO56_19375 [Hymenobacter sp.]|nr:MAG: hypothetical protein EOO56_19375 [Hymenobacter sp.]